MRKSATRNLKRSCEHGKLAESVTRNVRRSGRCGKPPQYVVKTAPFRGSLPQTVFSTHEQRWGVCPPTPQTGGRYAERGSEHTRESSEARCLSRSSIRSGPSIRSQCNV